MCYRKPGARCAKEILKSLKAARVTVEKHRQQLETGLQNMRELKSLRGRLMSPEKKKRLESMIEKQALVLAEQRESYDTALYEYTSVLAEYDATLTGQRALREMIQKSRKEGMTNHAEVYAQRLERGKRLRAEIRARYKTTWGIDADVSHEGSVPTPQDIITMSKENSRVEVVYKGIYKKRHGVCEVVAIEGTSDNGKYTLRTIEGEYMHHVNGDSLRLIGD